jgi:site-specific DNA recombinase
MPVTSTSTPSATSLRAVLYLRVSLDRYARLRASSGIEDRGSMPKQERAGRDLIDRKCWNLEALRFDPIGASEYTRKQREQWPEVLAMVDAGHVDVVVLWETSRGDRKLTTWSGFLDSCKARGILIHILEHDTTYDVRRPRDWEILAEEGIRNARESHKISSRVKSAKAELRHSGRPEGSITYGYRSVYDPQTGILLRREPDPETAPHVLWAFTAFKSGASIRDVVTGLRERDPSRTWSRTGVRKLLVNPRVAGWIRDGSELREAQWKPLVERKIWTDVQDRLEENARVGARPGAVKHLCSHIATASPCGGPLGYVSERQSAQQKAGRSRPFYKCQKDGCVGIRADWLDGFVAAKVVAFWADKAKLAALQARSEQQLADLADLRRRKRELDAKLAEIGREGAALPIQTVIAMTQTVQADLTDVIARIDQITPRQSRPLIEGDNEDEVLKAWHRLKREVGVSAQREVVRGTLQYIKVFPRGRGFHREFDPAYVDAPYRQFG